MNSQAKIRAVDDNPALLNATQRVQESAGYETLQQNFYNVLNASLNEFYIFDAQTLRFEFVSAGAVRNLGYSLDELRQMTPLDLKPEQTTESFANLIQPLCSHTAQVVNFETTHQRADGSRYPVDVHLQLFDQLERPVFLAVILDISARKQAEEALRESEDKFKYVFDHSVSGKSITLVSGEINVNQALCDMLGYTPEELKNRKWQEISHPDDLELTQAEMNALLSKQKETARFTKRFLHKNGSIIWVEMASTLRRDEDGKPLYFLTSINDITERKRSESALRQSEAFNQALLENSPIGISVRSRTGRLLSANEAWKKIWAISEEDFQEDIARERHVFHFNARDDYLKPYQADLRRVYEQGGHLHLPELRVIHPRPGAAKWVSQHFYAIQDAQGQVDRVVIMTEDISERKQADESLRLLSVRQEAILAAVPDILMEVDTNKVYTWANPAGLAFFGPDVIGRDAQFYFAGEQETYQSVQTLFDGDENTIYVESWQRRCDGEKRLLGWWCRVIKDDSGNVVGALSSARDITENRLAENEIRTTNAELEARVEARTRELREAQEQIVRQEKLAVLGQLAGGVGHELRNPLTVINNAIYFLKLIQPDADAKVKEYLALIQNETHNAEKIINDLLDFARTKGAMREVLEVKALVAGVLKRFPAPEGIHVTLDILDGLPAVYADSRQMEQVLGNLVVNACQAMSSGGQLTISAAQQADKIAIAVKDTGVGIPPENMKKLFEPLFTTKARGIGLGLAVSKKLVEANGGQIAVESEPGKGSTFTVFLPTQAADGA